MDGCTALLISTACNPLPVIVGRKKRDAGAILAMNFFLGWTFVGWVVALVWACKEDTPR
jgi:hypothetical protein